MLTRRDLVTGTAFGALSTAALPTSGREREPHADSAQDAEAQVSQIRQEMRGIEGVLNIAVRQNSLSFGTVPKIREQFNVFLRANHKFPNYCEIGLNVFYDLYDWHVKNHQPLNVTRQAENRLAVQFMFTQMVLRPEQELNFVGLPFDVWR